MRARRLLAAFAVVGLACATVGCGPPRPPFAPGPPGVPPGHLVPAPGHLPHPP